MLLYLMTVYMKWWPELYLCIFWDMNQTEWLGILCIRNMVFVTLQIFLKLTLKKIECTFECIIRKWTMKANQDTNMVRIFVLLYVPWLSLHQHLSSQYHANKQTCPSILHTQWYLTKLSFTKLMGVQQSFSA